MGALTLQGPDRGQHPKAIKLNSMRTTFRQSARVSMARQMLKQMLEKGILEKWNVGLVT
jgi:hypothetical protein